MSNWASRVVVAAIGCWILGLLLTLSGSLAIIIAGLAIGSASGFVCQSVSTSHVALNARQARSAAIGLYVTTYYIGGSVGGVKARRVEYWLGSGRARQFLVDAGQVAEQIRPAPPQPIAGAVELF